MPVTYGGYRFEVPTFFHVDVKPDRRMFLSQVWKQYLLAVDQTDQSNAARFDDYVDRILKTDWRGAGIDEAASEWASEHFRGLVPYDEQLYGACPSLLKPHLEH